MKPPAIRLVFCLAFLLCAVGVSAQISTSQTGESTHENTSSAAAYVYVGTGKGVNLYAAAVNGKLTRVSGSPFKTVGKMIGSNGKYFISLGTNWVHSYPVDSNGAIRAQVSQTNTQDYGGAVCGTTNGAALDQTDRNLYVLLNTAHDVYGNGICFAYQTFNIAKESGTVTFNGAAVVDNSQAYLCCTSPTLTGNNTFAYSLGPQYYGLPYALYPFVREKNGTLESWTFNETDPTPPPPGFGGGYYYVPLVVTGDPTDHLAIAVQQWYAELYGSPAGPPQLASYTVDNKGNISSNNTWENMPTPKVYPTSLKISPSGRFLAVAGNYLDPYHFQTEGVQVFRFNGAKPITPYGRTLTTAPINDIQWDTNNHLYALSYSTHQLFVYTISSTGIVEAPESPYEIASPNGLVVVPRHHGCDSGQKDDVHDEESDRTMDRSSDSESGEPGCHDEIKGERTKGNNR